MNLDAHGLPIQSDGDNRDQLQRCGMILVAQSLLRRPIDSAILRAVQSGLQVRPGIFSRYIGGARDNVSADQLIPIISFNVIAGLRKQSLLLFFRMLQRFGFAQNYHDGLSAKTSIKIPDLMLFRALPLFARISWALYPLALIADLYLLMMAVSSGLDRNPDHVDDNNLIITLVACRALKPTPWSVLAARIYNRLRPWNLGCVRKTARGQERILGALRHYHREAAGGNPEIAELWKPLVEKYLGDPRAGRMLI